MSLHSADLLAWVSSYEFFLAHLWSLKFTGSVPHLLQSGSLLYLIILLAGSNTGYGLPSVANDITSNQFFKMFYNLFSFSIISRQITDHPLII